MRACKGKGYGVFWGTQGFDGLGRAPEETDYSTGRMNIPVNGELNFTVFHISCL